MTGSLIKKHQVIFSDSRQKSKPKSGEKRVLLELKVPQEQIDQRVSAMKEELMQDVYQLQAELENNRTLLLEEKTEMDQMKNELEQRIALESEKSRLAFEQAQEKGHIEGTKNGYKKGFDEGFHEGHQKGQSEFDAIKDEYIAHSKELLNKIQEINEFKKLIFEKTEPYFLTLIKGIVQKVIAAEVSQTPDQILMIIRDALKRVADMSSVRVRVHPQHLTFLNDHKARLLSSIGTIHEMDILEDTTLDVGGCIIETDFGVVNASIETKMISILELLNKTYDNLHAQNSEVVLQKDTVIPPVQQIDELRFDDTSTDDEPFSLFDEDDEDEDDDDDDDDDDDLDIDEVEEDLEDSEDLDEDE